MTKTTTTVFIVSSQTDNVLVYTGNKLLKQLAPNQTYGSKTDFDTFVGTLEEIQAKMTELGLT
jgi:hypothetical protein